MVPTKWSESPKSVVSVMMGLGMITPEYVAQVGAGKLPYTHIREYVNMYSMKTTVEISDSLFQAAKACAESRGVPMRQIIEEGLRTVIQQRMSSRKPFRLRDGSFRGKGLQGELSWPEIRRKIYEGRGE